MQFDQVSETIRGSLRSNLQHLTGEAEGIAHSISAHAASTQATWPNVTLPNFEIQADRIRENSWLDHIIFAPLVSEENFDGWNEYSQAHQGWIDESFKAHGRAFVDYQSIPPKIYNVGNKPLVFPSAPFWQLSPPPISTDIVNLNAFSSSKDSLIFDTVLISRSFVIGNFSESSPLQDASQHRILVNEDENSSVLVKHHSTMVHPIFTSFLDSTSSIVGFIISYLHWESYLQDLVPTGVRGIFLVLRNSCGQSLTYELEDGATVFVGEGDLHEIGELDERDFDDYEVVINLLPLLNGREISQGQNDCVYQVSVFPSARFWNDYDSDMPYVFAIVVSFTSLLMAIFFFTYDSSVESRTKKIISEAAQSNAIVSSLFPAELRDRLFKDGEDDTTHTLESSLKKHRTGKHGLKSFLLGGKALDGNIQGSSQKPIADLFPETTIMFAGKHNSTLLCLESVILPTHVFPS